MNLEIPPRDDGLGDQRQFEEERDSKLHGHSRERLNGRIFICRAFGLTAAHTRGAGR